MFSIYTLLGDSSPVVSIELLNTEIQNIFKSDKHFSVQRQRLLEQPALGLRWGDWYLATVFCEEGQRISDDSEVIVKTLKLSSVKTDNMKRRIRAIFYDNEQHDYTNEIISIIDYLCRIDGAVVFDPLNDSLWPHPLMDKWKSNSPHS